MPVVFVRARCRRKDSGRGMSYLMTATVVLKKESDCVRLRVYRQSRSEGCKARVSFLPRY